MIWAIIPVRKKIKILRENELLKKKKGWFGGGGTELTQSEQKELEGFIESAFEGEQSIRSPNNLFFKIDLKIKGGNFTFIDRKTCKE